MIYLAQRCCLAVLAASLSFPLVADEGKAPSPVAGSIDESIELGIAFLVADQNENGSWGSARQTKGLNIYAPVPGAHNAFRAAVTAMAISATTTTRESLAHERECSLSRECVCAVL